jgi:hypothetical protein
MSRSALALIACALARAQNADPGAKAIEEFQRRVADYVKLHDKAKSSLDKLKPTTSADRISAHEKELAHREHAVQGNIFTPEIASAFHQLVGATTEGPDAVKVHQSLRRSEPVVIQLKVNRSYPVEVPLQTTPPSLLQNLPKLPPELEYRVVGKALVLRDVNANLIVDFLPNALP